MPTVVPKGPPAQSVKPSKGAAAKHPHPSLQSRKQPRVNRRRAAGHLDLSDDELEREARTDSGSDHSSVRTETDAESDSDTDARPLSGAGRTRSTSSPPLNEVTSPPRQSKHQPSKPNGNSKFVTSQHWSDMVDNAANNKQEELPVIDFAELDSSRLEKLSSNTSTDDAPAPAKTKPITTASSDNPPSSKRQQASANGPMKRIDRQTYLDRLSSDPSYIPRVGAFWGHDDRLMDKELRGMSTWWRGKRAARGRGGFRGGRGGRGGRTGFVNGHTETNDSTDPQQDEAPTAPLPPIERPWTHNGYEEMKAQEETSSKPGRGAKSTRGTAKSARGRGGAPGGRAGDNASSRTNSSLPPSAPRSFTARGYPFKNGSERPWTKHSDTFLYFEQELKVRFGAQGVRIHLPGTLENIVQVPIPVARGKGASIEPKRSEQQQQQQQQQQRTPTDKRVVVRLPSHSVSRSTDSKITIPEKSTTAEEPIIDTASPVVKLPTASPVIVKPVLPEVVPPPTEPPQLISLSNDVPPSTASDPPTATATKSEVAMNAEVPQAEEGTQLEASQVTDSVPPQSPHSGHDSSTSYPSHTNPAHSQPLHPPHGYPAMYSPYPIPLPPGVALNEGGVPYDVASGRLVVFTPPPPPMFTPRPMMPSHLVPRHAGMPFVPPHLQAMTPDFMTPTPPAHISTPDGGYVYGPPSALSDHSNGAPIFVPPRANGRIEIRAPGTESSSTSTTTTAKADKPSKGPVSNLRMDASAEPFKPRSSTPTTPITPSHPQHHYQHQHNPYYTPHEAGLHYAAPMYYGTPDGGFHGYGAAPTPVEYGDASANGMPARYPYSYFPNPAESQYMYAPPHHPQQQEYGYPPYQGTDSNGYGDDPALYY